MVDAYNNWITLFLGFQELVAIHRDWTQDETYHGSNHSVPFVDLNRDWVSGYPQTTASFICIRLHVHNFCKLKLK